MLRHPVDSPVPAALWILCISSDFPKSKDYWKSRMPVFHLPHSSMAFILVPCTQKFVFSEHGHLPQTESASGRARLGLVAMTRAWDCLSPWVPVSSMTPTNESPSHPQPDCVEDEGWLRHSGVIYGWLQKAKSLGLDWKCRGGCSLRAMSTPISPWEGHGHGPVHFIPA